MAAKRVFLTGVLVLCAGAAALAATEGLMRDATMRREFADINTIIGDRQRGCNALSIAAATGLPRETVRRKMGRLVEMGILVRRDAGNFIWQPGVLQAPPHRQLLEEWAAEKETGVASNEGRPPGERAS